MKARDADAALTVLAALTVVAGVALTAYAALLLPDDLGDGLNPVSRPRRVIQFAFALGIPLCGTGAYRMARRGRVRPAVAWLALAPVAFGGWVATFFDWSDAP